MRNDIADVEKIPYDRGGAHGQVTALALRELAIAPIALTTNCGLWPAPTW